MLPGRQRSSGLSPLGLGKELVSCHRTARVRGSTPSFNPLRVATLPPQLRLCPVLGKKRALSLYFSSKNLSAQMLSPIKSGGNRRRNKNCDYNSKRALFSEREISHSVLIPTQPSRAKLRYFVKMQQAYIARKSTGVGTTIDHCDQYRDLHPPPCTE